MRSISPTRRMGPFAAALLLSAASTQSQVAIQDALKLRHRFVSDSTFDLKTGNDSLELSAILVHYLDDANPVPVDGVLKKFKENPFVKPMFSNRPPPPSGSGNPHAARFPDERTVQGIPAPLALLGGLDATVIADGFAKFLIQRTRQELTTAYFKRMKMKMAAYPELAVLFPATRGLLSEITGMDYAAFLPALREAFRSDMNSLGMNVLNLRDLSPGSFPGCKDACRTRIEGTRSYFGTKRGKVATAALILFERLSSGINLADALSATVRDTGVVNDSLAPLLQVLKITELFSQSLRGGAGSVWIGPDSLKRALDDAPTLRLFLGLIYQRALTDSLRIDTALFAHRLEALRPGLRAAAAYAEKIAAQARLIENLAGEIRAAHAQDREESASRNRRNSRAWLDLIASVAGFFPSESGLPADYRTELERFHTGVSFYRDLGDRNYPALILDADRLLSGTGPEKKPLLPEAFIRYGGFIAAVAHADGSDEVSAAIEAAALPAGSYSTKRMSRTNLALNAYVGGFYGFESMHAGLDRNKYSFGVWAPIGAAMSLGTKGGFSHSIFITFADLGALTAFRLEKGDSATLPEMDFKNVWAPGAYYVLGTTMPISIGMGGQIAPSLREIASDGEAVKQSHMLMRYSLTVSVDIPLFDFYTSPRDN